MSKKLNDAVQQILDMDMETIRSLELSVKDVISANNLLDSANKRHEYLQRVKPDSKFKTANKYFIAAASAANSVMAASSAVALADVSLGLVSASVAYISQRFFSLARRMTPQGIHKRHHSLHKELEQLRNKHQENIAEIGLEQSLIGSFACRTDQYVHYMPRMSTQAQRNKLSKAFRDCIDDLVQEAMRTNRETLSDAIRGLGSIQKSLERGMRYYREQQTRQPSRFKWKNQLHLASTIQSDQDFVSAYVSVSHALNELENALNGHVELVSENQHAQQSMFELEIITEYSKDGSPPKFSAKVDGKDVEVTVDGQDVYIHGNRPINKPDAPSDPSRNIVLLNTLFPGRRRFNGAQHIDQTSAREPISLALEI